MDPIIANICRISTNFTKANDAYIAHEDLISTVGKTSLILDMSKRALMRSVATKTGSHGFASELFSEIVSYLASRDLPSYIGAKGRISTPNESIALKNKFRENARQAAKTVPIETSNSGWINYVKKVTKILVSSDIKQ